MILERRDCICHWFLKGKDQEFFLLVHEAAFSNPFSPERDALDYKIAGESKKLTPPALLSSVVKAVRDRLQVFGRFSLSDFAEPDQNLIRSAVWFDCFHKHADGFDKLIHDQIRAKDSQITVPFGEDLMGELGSYGISEKESARIIAIFYQLRRAYFFIGRTLIGNAQCMQTLRSHLWNNIFTLRPDWYEQYLWSHMEDFSTLLLGQTGTGKGAVASAIGRSGFIPYDVRKKMFEESFTTAFVAINVSEFPATLIESELFGHKKGAFTGAIGDYVGVFGRCSPRGAIFLDELGDIDMATQVKLLRVIQERTFTPVGSHEKQRFSGRVIAATNKDLTQLRNAGTFRDDLYYRLCSDLIHLPTLQKRFQESKDELDELTTHLVHRLLGRDAPELSRDLLQMIKTQIPKTYDWPGNVRELEQCLRRLLVVGTYERESALASNTLVGNAVEESMTAGDLLSEYCRQLYDRLGTYEEVSKITDLDRRTVKKYISST